MNFSSLNKKTILLLAALLVICLILLTVAVLLVTRSSSENPPLSLSSGTKTPLQILSSTPDDTALLKPGIPGSFSVTFNHAVLVENLSVLLTQYSIPTQKTVQVPVAITLDKTNTIANIISTDPLKGYSSYTLTLSEKNFPTKLLSKTYQMDYPLPTPLPQNNLELKTYLPYKTAAFTLSYLPSENVYVFNLLSYPSSTETVQAQFTKAKEEALSYIKSKGIDPNSVTIDWRYH